MAWQNLTFFQHLHFLFHHAILQGVEADDQEPSPGGEQGWHGGEQGLEGPELVVDGDAQGLEGAGRRVVARLPSTGTGHWGFRYAP